MSQAGKWLSKYFSVTTLAACCRHSLYVYAACVVSVDMCEYLVLNRSVSIME